MEPSEALAKVLGILGINAKNLADKLGYSRPEKLYKILRGESKTISQAIINDIVKAYPEVNERFLLSFEGDILKDNSRQFKLNQITNYIESNKGAITVNEDIDDAYLERKLEGGNEELVRQVAYTLMSKVKKLESEIESYKELIKSKDEIIQSKNELIELLKSK